MELSFLYLGLFCQAKTCLKQQGHSQHRTYTAVLPNAQTANDMGTQKITSISNRGVSNVPVTT
jgi:hypothetical protein